MHSRSQEEVKRGDDPGWIALYDRYGQVIFGYLRSHAPSLEDAEDLLLEVFLAAFEKEHLAALAPEEQLAWLKRVAYNKLANVYRRTRRHPQIPLDVLAETFFEEEGPEQLALQQEEHGQLRTHIQQLPPMQRHLLQLRYGDGLSCAEIALLLNKREGAVRKILSRTILYLRQIYHQREGENIC